MNNAQIHQPTFVEEGEAFRKLSGLAPASPERFDVIVIGGGQAGLSVGYQLKKLGLSFLILEANPRVGDVWRNRWDSLRLFSPARFDALEGMPFPGAQDAFPTKDEMADYLEAYARRFELPIRTGVRVDRLWREGDRYRVSAGALSLEADQVVIALGSYQGKRVPPFAAALSPEIVQLHSSEYKNLSQLKPGGVLIVGAGNSGAEIAVETVKRHPTWVWGRDPGDVPFKATSLLGRLIFLPLLFRIVFHRVLTVKTPMGKKARVAMLGKGNPRIRQTARDLDACGVRRVPKTVAIKDGLPVLEDGQTLNITNVIWCIGFSSGLSFVDLPIFEANGEPRHTSGVVDEQPGLFFVGQHFQHAMSSGMIHGVGRDAAFIASALSAQRRTALRLS